MKRTRLPQSLCHFGLYSALFTTGIIIGLNMKWDNCDRNYHENEMHNSELIQLDETYLVILIFSEFSNVNRRDIIRETWLKLGAERRFKHYFVIGTLDLVEDQLNNLYDEQKKNDDLLLFPHLKDTYSALSLKLLTSLKWFANKIKFNYLLKVDDDSFVQIDKLFDELVEEKFKTSNALYWGYFDGRAHVKRRGQWMEKRWILCDRYLPYALGGGYVISHDLVTFVSKNSDILQLYANEDVSLGVWLAPLILNRIHDIRFDTEFESRGCSNNYLITHKQSIVDMKSLYYNLQSLGRLCEKEVRFKNAYDYNWLNVPSQCCYRNITD